jgi:hypothetical protein
MSQVTWSRDPVQDEIGGLGRRAPDPDACGLQGLASFFACAVPDEPGTMAPAWPVVLPSDAVKPATQPMTGLLTRPAAYAAARSSASPSLR